MFDWIMGHARCRARTITTSSRGFAPIAQNLLGVRQ
jgi:hypothetical protein